MDKGKSAVRGAVFKSYQKGDNMDKKKIMECLEELKEKCESLASLIEGDKKEISSIEELREKATEKTEEEE